MEDVLKKALLALLFLPVITFTAAGVTELRSNASLDKRVSRLVPICCGLFAIVAFVNPQGLFHVTPSGSVVLSRVMTLISALIACSGVFISYSRPRTAILVAIGGWLLALFWIFNVVLV